MILISQINTDFFFLHRKFWLYEKKALLVLYIIFKFLIISEFRKVSAVRWKGQCQRGNQSVWWTDRLSGLASKTSQPIRVKIKEQANEMHGIRSLQSGNVSGVCSMCSASAEVLCVFRRVQTLNIEMLRRTEFLMLCWGGCGSWSR